MATGQKYRMTFKCSCGNLFKKITTNRELLSAPCPKCRKKDKITKFMRHGDGPIPDSEVAPKKKVIFPNVIYKCSDCNGTTKIREEVGDTSLTSCPACDSVNIKYIGHISHNVADSSKLQIKAIDTTADIVMQDYKLGDLRDDVRQGESMAPKIAPALQKQADSFFGPKKSGNIPFNPKALAKQAIAGQFRDKRTDPVMAIQQPRFKPKIDIIASTGREIKT